MASEEFWEDVLGHLKERVLVPIVGPEAVTLDEGSRPLTLDEGSRPLTLSRALGQRLANKYALGVDWSQSDGLGDAVRAFLVTRGSLETERLYRVVNDLLAGLDATSGAALRHLGAITDLRLFVSTTFDGSLARAIDSARFGGEKQTRELWFSPNQSTSEQQRNAIPPAEDEVVVFKL